MFIKKKKKHPDEEDNKRKLEETVDEPSSKIKRNLIGM